MVAIVFNKIFVHVVDLSLQEQYAINFIVKSGPVGFTRFLHVLYGGVH